MSSELVLLKLNHNQLEHSNQHRHNLQLKHSQQQALKLNLHRLNQLKLSLLMTQTFMEKVNQMHNLQLLNNRNQMVQLETKTVMTLATTMQITMEARTLMLEPVRVVLVATRSRSQPSSERELKRL